MVEIQLSNHPELEIFVSSDLYKTYFPENTPGWFKSYFPFLHDKIDKLSISVASYQITGGFFNVTKDEDIVLIKRGLTNYEKIAVGTLKSGYYSSTQELLQTINNVIY